MIFVKIASLNSSIHLLDLIPLSVVADATTGTVDVFFSASLASYNSIGLSLANGEVANNKFSNKFLQHRA